MQNNPFVGLCFCVTLLGLASSCTLSTVPTTKDVAANSNVWQLRLMGIYNMESIAGAMIVLEIQNKGHTGLHFPIIADNVSFERNSADDAVPVDLTKTVLMSRLEGADGNRETFSSKSPQSWRALSPGNKIVVFIPIFFTDREQPIAPYRLIINYKVNPGNAYSDEKPSYQFSILMRDLQRGIAHVQFPPEKQLSVAGKRLNE